MFAEVCWADRNVSFEITAHLRKKQITPLWKIHLYEYIFEKNVCFVILKHISVTEKQECGILFVHDLDSGNRLWQGQPDVLSGLTNLALQRHNRSLWTSKKIQNKKTPTHFKPWVLHTVLCLSSLFMRHSLVINTQIELPFMQYCLASNWFDIWRFAVTWKNTPQMCPFWKCKE